MSVSFDTVRSLRKLVRLKLGATELERAYLNAPQTALGDRSPREILESRDFYEIMRLSVMVSSMSPPNQSGTQAA